MLSKLMEAAVHRSLRRSFRYAQDIGDLGVTHTLLVAQQDGRSLSFGKFLEVGRQLIYQSPGYRGTFGARIIRREYLSGG